MLGQTIKGIPEKYKYGSKMVFKLKRVMKPRNKGKSDEKMDGAVSLVPCSASNNPLQSEPGYNKCGASF